MTALRKGHMTANEFLGWAPLQPERWELFDGVPTAMSPERVIHGDTKYRAARAFHQAIEIPCLFVLDSAVVRIDAKNTFQPDVLVYRGEPVAADALEVPNPVIVVEVLSPGNAITDLRDKLRGHFLLASIQHYLIVDPDKRLVIHHARGQNGTVATRIVGDGVLTLNPPGLVVPVVDFFVAESV